MARHARIENEGAFYHVMNRGNYREDIFLDDKDRLKFYEILGDIERRYEQTASKAGPYFSGQI